ncbi:MAG: VWA domain-containing protein [Candidatus Bipolaricaulota bacterium]
MRIARWCLVLLMLLAAVTSVAGARELVFILDASNSMNIVVEDQGTRFAWAKQALQNVIEELDEEVPFGLVVFGHRVPHTRPEESCEDIELLVPFDNHAGAERQSVVREIDALGARGNTPLASSMEYAAEVHPEARIVLLTDGEETCHGDPEAVAQGLSDRGQILDIVAVSVSPRIQAELTALAEGTGGRFLMVDDPALLPEKLLEVAIDPPTEPEPPAPEIPEALKRYRVDPGIVTVLLEHLPYDICSPMWDVILRFLERNPPDNVIVGTERGDALFGTSGNDLIIGVHGNNRISGFAENDLLIGGSGDDVIQGGSGNNLILGGAGDDVLTGGSGCDILYGEQGDDHIESGGGTNWIYGGPGNDTILGGDGCNYIDPGAGRNSVVDLGTCTTCAEATAAGSSDPCRAVCVPRSPEPCERERPSVCTVTPEVRTVKAGESIVLRARAYDPDRDPAEVTWSAPRGFFSDPHALETIYYAPPHTICEGEEIEVTVTAVDPCGEKSTDTVTVRVLRDNRPPVVNAGRDRSVDEGERVQICATAHDPDCDEMTFTWAAECGRGTFVDPHVLCPVYIAPSTPPCTDEKVVLTLTVRDECGAVSKDSLRVHVRSVSHPPTVDAGPDLTVCEGGRIMILAEAQDPDGGPLSVSWWASEGSFMNAHTLNPVFLAPSPPSCEGLVVEVRVLVTDCQGNVAEDFLNIHVESVNRPPRVDIED